MSLMDILAQVASGNATDQHYDQAINQAPSDVLGKGLAAAFRSDQTPDIGKMVGQLFGNSNGSQQAGMLNQILATLGPAALSAVAGGVMGKMLTPGATQISPDQASKLSPQQVQDIVTEAHQQQPALADQLGSFYAEHSGLIKTLGGAALAIAMANMKNHMAQRT
jgi:hypothetical protein